MIAAHRITVTVSQWQRRQSLAFVKNDFGALIERVDQLAIGEPEFGRPLDEYTDAPTREKDVELKRLAKTCIAWTKEAVEFMLCAPMMALVTSSGEAELVERAKEAEENNQAENRFPEIKIAEAHGKLVSILAIIASTNANQISRQDAAFICREVKSNMEMMNDTFGAIKAAHAVKAISELSVLSDFVDFLKQKRKNGDSAAA